MIEQHADRLPRLGARGLDVAPGADVARDPVGELTQNRRRRRRSAGAAPAAARRRRASPARSSTRRRTRAAPRLVAVSPPRGCRGERGPPGRSVRRPGRGGDDAAWARPIAPPPVRVSAIRRHQPSSASSFVDPSPTTRRSPAAMAARARRRSSPPRDRPPRECPHDDPRDGSTASARRRDRLARGVAPDPARGWPPCPWRRGCRASGLPSVALRRPATRQRDAATGSTPATARAAASSRRLTGATRLGRGGTEVDARLVERAPVLGEQLEHRARVAARPGRTPGSSRPRRPRRRSASPRPRPRTGPAGRPPGSGVAQVDDVVDALRGQPRDERVGPAPRPAPFIAAVTSRSNASAADPACSVHIEPGMPAFIASSIGSASAPRTSPTITRVTDIRSVWCSRSDSVISPAGRPVAGSRSVDPPGTPRRTAAGACPAAGAGSARTRQASSSWAPRLKRYAASATRPAPARRLRQQSVPLLPGTVEATTLEESREFMASLGAGAQVMVKAVAGGGGRGMLPVSALEDLPAAYERCSSEALKAFGSGDLYVEQLLSRARHIEVQILGDGTGEVIHLWDRDCSVQRRRQKLIEIAPARSAGHAAQGHAASRRGTRASRELQRTRHRRVLGEGRSARLPRGEPPHSGGAHRHRGGRRSRPGRAPATRGRRHDALTSWVSLTVSTSRPAPRCSCV